MLDTTYGLIRNQEDALEASDAVREAVVAPAEVALAQVALHSRAYVKVRVGV